MLKTKLFTSNFERFLERCRFQLLEDEFEFPLDRFIVIDNKEAYLSLEAFSKKWFSFSKIRADIFGIKGRLR